MSLGKMNIKHNSIIMKEMTHFIEVDPAAAKLIHY